MQKGGFPDGIRGAQPHSLIMSAASRVPPPPPPPPLRGPWAPLAPSPGGLMSLCRALSTPNCMLRRTIEAHRRRSSACPPQRPINVIVTHCLQMAKAKNSAPRNASNPASGPREVPPALKALQYTVIGLDGTDYTHKVTLLKPTLRWVLDMAASLSEGDGTVPVPPPVGSRPPGVSNPLGGSLNTTDWTPLTVGVVA